MKKIFYTLMFIFTATVMYAQSADVVTEILETTEVTFGQVCYLSAVQQGLVDDNASYEDSIKVLYENNQLPGEVYSGTPIALVDLAFIYSRLWNVHGGFFYQMTHGAPRYAFKQLKTDGVISEKAEPGDFISGSEALNIFTSCLVTYGGMTLDNMEDSVEDAEEANN